MLLCAKKVGCMHINNVSSKMSGQSTAWFALFSVVVTLFVGFFFWQSNSDSYSISSFCQWYSSAFNAFRESSTENPIDPWLVMVGLPLLVYGGTLFSIFSMCMAKKEFQSVLNLKSVDFLPDRVNFNFNQPKYNFVCGYSDINKLEMILKTILVRTKRGSYPAVSEIELKFTVLNNKNFSLKNVPLNLMKTIYGIIDCGRNVQDFTYKFSGVGKVEEVQEKIEDYMNTGCKQILATSTENAFKYLSVIFFLIGLFFLYSFKDVFSGNDLGLMGIPGFPILAFVLISFIFDIVLLADKRNEKKYNFNKKPDRNSNFWEKVPPMALFIVKVIVLLVMLLVCCPTLIFSHNDRKILNDTEYYKVLEETETAQKTQTADTNVANEAKTNGGYVNLSVNPLSSLNYLTRKQIYDLRKGYVQKSLFASKEYEPNAEVFGGIVDGKPWWTTNPCTPLNYEGDYHERIQGNSKVSAQLNNPNALVGISMAYSPWEYEANKEFCRSKAAAFIPERMSYNQKENLIVAEYKVPSYFYKLKSHVNEKLMGYPLQLSGMNAIDFGYDYVYAYEAKNISMMDPESSNMTTDVQTFRDYIHLGGSCKYKDGCNNISPLQNNLMFAVDDLPAIITLKLWKKQPMNKYIKGDIYYKILITDN